MATSYRELIVWERAMQLAEAVYAASAKLPDAERFGLAAQLRRAAVSVPSNIAEGYERRSRADYRRFITIACGSVAEIETQVMLGERLGFLFGDTTEPVHRLADEVGRMLRAIERSLRVVDGVREEPGADAWDTLQPSALSSQP